MRGCANSIVEEEDPRSQQGQRQWTVQGPYPRRQCKVYRVSLGLCVHCKAEPLRSDLQKENHHLSLRIQQLEAALASKGTGPAIHHTGFWNQYTPIRREVQGYIPAPAAQANYQPHQPRFMAPDQPLEAMPPTPEHEGQMDEETFQMSWSGSNNSATATASGSGSGNASESPVAPGASPDSNYSPENGSSTLHSSSSHDSSPTGTALDLRGPSFGQSLQYPTNGNNGLGLEFVPGAMEIQVGTMGWQG